MTHNEDHQTTGRDNEKEAKRTEYRNKIEDFLSISGEGSKNTYVAVECPGIGGDYNPALRQREDPDSVCFAEVMLDHIPGVQIGDMLFIDKKAEPRHQDLVVADVDGQPVFRRFLLENEEAILHSDDPEHVIRADNHKALGIWGVVKQIFRCVDNVE